MPPAHRTLTEAVLGVPDEPMTPEQEASLAERIDLVLHTLGPREAYVIRQRFLRKPPRTTEQVAASLRVAPSRASQIEAQALRKLRLRPRSSHLRPRVAVERTLASFCSGHPPVPPPPVLVAVDLPGDARQRLLLGVGALPLGARAAGALANGGIDLVGDLVEKTEGQLLRLKNFGRCSLRAVKEVLTAHGLQLGVKVNGWASMRAAAMGESPKDLNNGERTAGPAGVGDGSVLPDPLPARPERAPQTVDRLPPEIARAVLNRLLAVRPELRDVAQRLADSVVAVLQDEPVPAPPPAAAPPMPDPRTGGLPSSADGAPVSSSAGRTPGEAGVMTMPKGVKP